MAAVHVCYLAAARQTTRPVFALFSLRPNIPASTSFSGKIWPEIQVVFRIRQPKLLKNRFFNSLGFLRIPYYLRQKPRPLFALIDPNLDQTRGGDIVVPIANLV